MKVTAAQEHVVVGRGTDLVLAADVGGTFIKLGLVKAGQIVSLNEIRAISKRGILPALARISKETKRLCSAAGIQPRQIGGLGIAFPGIVEPATGRILSTPAGKFEDAPSLDLPKAVEQIFGLPLAVVNDANAALLGEWQFGVARGCQNVVMMTLGTGIGTAVILEGVPLRGEHGQAGCLGGHFTVNLHGIRCGCGNVGCFESEASTWALTRKARSQAEFAASQLSARSLLDYYAVFESAAHGDRVAVALRNYSLRVWGALAVSLIHAYDPERLVIGGGVMASAELILPSIQTYVSRHAWTPWGRVEVVGARQGNRAGLLGAAWFAEKSLKQKYFQ